MKHKKNYITRIYTFLHILEHCIVNRNDKLEPSSHISDLFLHTMETTIDQVDLGMHSHLVESYVNNKTLIDKTRETFQKRLEQTIDLSVKTIINLAMAEYLYYKLDKKLIINIYVNIMSVFDQGSTGFVHGVLDKSLDFLQQKTNI